ncbi:MAG: DNA phosphorothioation-dependent restriction protein DptH, partial [Clostridium sp.]
MSDQFYSYLSEKIISFFTQNPLTSGAKYNVQFETEDQVIALYDELKNNTLYKEFEYKDGKGEVKYRSYLLDFEGVKLIISATTGSITPDFLTRLRNMVGVESGYEDKGILFIHNTTLDSIMGGTESFSKEGMPFHISNVEKDIKGKLVTSDFTDVEKEIIALDLERKKNETLGDTVSIFEYKDLLETINSSCIEMNQYKNFGLFPDSKLDGLEGKELKSRLKSNADYFSKVDEIHNYGNPDTQLERYFDDAGVNKLKGADWKDIDFKDVQKSVDRKKEITPLAYMGSSADWDKEEGSSKAKQRVRNIIVFNPENLESHELEFSFDDFLKQSGVDVQGEVEAVTSGKKLKVKISNVDGKSNFYKVVYKNEKNLKFEFKIVMVKCHEKAFESIKTKFSIIIKKKDAYIALNTNDSTVAFNEFGTAETNYSIDNNYETIELPVEDKLFVKIQENFKYENDDDLAKFKLKIGGELIQFGVIGTSEKISPIEGLKVWKLKREKEEDFKFVGDNKLQFGTKEYFTRDEFRKNLELEKKLIELEGISFLEGNNGIENLDLDIDSDIKRAFGEIIEYYKLSSKLPSLTYLNDDLKVLYENFINAYINGLNSIKEGDYLSKEQKNLFKIGSIKREVGERELIFTSLHPLNIAYQLKLNGESSNEEMSEEIVKKFTSTYLLPYIMGDDDKLFIPMEQHHTPEWKYYVDETLPRYKSSRAFVAKLVTEKIEEFVGHFKYMFDMGGNAPIRINLINTGDSKEILQGIMKYYVKQIKGNKTSSILPIELFIYTDENITNAFEEVAFNDDIESLKSQYEIDLKVDSMSEEDVLNLYREKVHFYTKKVEEGIEYSHITFLEMSNDIKAITSKMTDIPSGIILNGLISGVP